MVDHISEVRLIRTGDLEPAARRAAERAVVRGTLERLTTGVLVEPGVIDRLRPDDRHRLLLRALLPLVRSGTTISHISAAVLHGLPVVDPIGPRIHVSDPSARHTVVTSRFIRHGVEMRPIRQPQAIGDAQVSGAARTVVDVAAVGSLEQGVVLVDHVLHSGAVTEHALLDAAGGLRKGHARARRAIGLGSTMSESPAESLCRVRFVQLRTPEPVQQHEFRRPGERPARVDFWFPAHGVAVEVDGRAKYELDGDPATAHWREKRREDFIRSFPEVRTVVRLSWSDLMDPERIRSALRRAGVPCR